MKWLGLPLLMLLSLAAAAQTATLTVSLVDYGNGAIGKNAIVRAELANCTTNPLADQGNGTYKILLKPADWRPNTTTGIVTATIMRNDYIDCGGQRNSTWIISYLVDNMLVRQQVYRIAKATFDLGNEAPIAALAQTQPIPPQTITFSSALSFSTINAGACASQTLGVVGAITGASIAPGWPAQLDAGLTALMFVSATNTVTVRLCNRTAVSVSPVAPMTFTGKVLLP